MATKIKAPLTEEEAAALGAVPVDPMDFLEALVAMDARAVAQGSSLAGILEKAASAFFGISILPLPVEEV